MYIVLAEAFFYGRRRREAEEEGQESENSCVVISLVVFCVSVSLVSMPFRNVLVGSLLLSEIIVTRFHALASLLTVANA